MAALHIFFGLMMVKLDVCVQNHGILAWPLLQAVVAATWRVHTIYMKLQPHSKPPDTRRHSAGVLAGAAFLQGIRLHHKQLRGSSSLHPLLPEKKILSSNK